MSLFHLLSTFVAGTLCNNKTVTDAKKIGETEFFKTPALRRCRTCEKRYNEKKAKP